MTKCAIQLLTQHLETRTIKLSVFDQARVRCNKYRILCTGSLLAWKHNGIGSIWEDLGSFGQ